MAMSISAPKLTLHFPTVEEDLRTGEQLLDCVLV